MPRDPEPAWRLANPARIERSRAASQCLPSGGWYVVGDSRRFRPAALRLPQRGTRNATPVGALRGGLHPRRLTIADHELVAWRPTPGAPLAIGPAACPHLGADLSDGWVAADGCITCPWHGLRLPADPGTRVPGQAGWRTLPVHDDGVLTWVRLDPEGTDEGTDAPILAKRPDAGIAAVMTRRATCEPADVIANRLDPWHGAHFHPYAFRDLTVLDDGIDAGVLTLDVTYRVVGRFGVPVRATFHCPEPRTIVMTIVEGEGTGSVVETHATPVTSAAPGRPPRTDVIEATIATSDRPGFERAALAAPVMRPLMRLAARRLWRDDAAYAERLHAQRSAGR
jgi:phenylpropionate dioxygenase-like ring-hydroxylating dioxygenase large terminal subunit